MSIADKLLTVSENVSKVYDAGKKSEYDRFWDGVQDYGKRKVYGYAFLRWSPDVIYPKYDIKPTGSISQMFMNLTGTTKFDLTTRFNECGVEFDTSLVTDMQYAFYNKLITRIPKLDTSSMNTLAYIAPSCESLVTVDELKLRDDGSQTFTDIFGWSTNLTDLTITGTIGQNGFDVSSNPKLSRESLISIVNALSGTTSGLAVTLNKTSVNNAFTESEWALLIATKSNWNITLI